MHVSNSCSSLQTRVPAESAQDTASDAGSLFSSRLWLDPWLAAFGTGAHGWWPVSAATRGFQIAYCIQWRSIAGYRMRVATGAVNAHTPRFDVCGQGVPGAGDFTRMMHELRVQALFFPMVPERSLLAAGFEQMGSKLMTHRVFSEDDPIIECSGSFEQYLEGRSKSLRKEWLAKESRILESGGSFECLSDWEQIEPQFEAILAVESSGWKGRQGTSLAQDGRAAGFYRVLFRSLAQRQLLRVFLLRWKGEIAAFHLCSLAGNRLSSLKIGYQERFGRSSPGKVAKLQMLRWAFERPEVKVVDQLGPATAAKMEWATSVERLWEYRVFRARPAGVAAAVRWKLAPMLKAALPGAKDDPKVEIVH